MGLIPKQNALFTIESGTVIKKYLNTLNIFKIYIREHF